MKAALIYQALLVAFLAWISNACSSEVVVHSGLELSAALCNSSSITTITVGQDIWMNDSWSYWQQNCDIVQNLTIQGPEGQLPAIDWFYWQGTNFGIRLLPYITLTFMRIIHKRIKGFDTPDLILETDNTSMLALHNTQRQLYATPPESYLVDLNHQQPVPVWAPNQQTALAVQLINGFCKTAPYPPRCWQHVVYVYVEYVDVPWQSKIPQGQNAVLRVSKFKHTLLIEEIISGSCLQQYFMGNLTCLNQHIAAGQSKATLSPTGWIPGPVPEPNQIAAAARELAKADATMQALLVSTDPTMANATDSAADGPNSASHLTANSAVIGGVVGGAVGVMLLAIMSVFIYKQLGKNTNDGPEVQKQHQGNHQRNPLSWLKQQFRHGSQPVNSDPHADSAETTNATAISLPGNEQGCSYSMEPYLPDVHSLHDKDNAAFLLVKDEVLTVSVEGILTKDLASTPGTSEPSFSPPQLQQSAVPPFAHASHHVELQQVGGQTSRSSLPQGAGIVLQMPAQGHAHHDEPYMTATSQCNTGSYHTASSAATTTGAEQPTPMASPRLTLPPLLTMSAAVPHGIPTQQGGGVDLAPAGHSYNSKECVMLNEIITPSTQNKAPLLDNIRLGSDLVFGHKLGSGGMGTVYQATYCGQQVAVKVLPPCASLKSFAHELGILGRVHHANIVHVIGACAVRGQPALVQELCDISLERLLYPNEQVMFLAPATSTASTSSPAPSSLHKSQASFTTAATSTTATTPSTVPPLPSPIPFQTVLHIALEIASGLAHLHPTIIHRDIKPGNILLKRKVQASNSPSTASTPQQSGIIHTSSRHFPSSPAQTSTQVDMSHRSPAGSSRAHISMCGDPLADYTVKLADFGLSRLMDAMTLVTQTPACGTLPYMAPECFERGKQVRLTHKSDIYSFGILLWEVLHGRRPFLGYSHAEVLYTVLVANGRPPISDHRCPAELRRLIERCWDRDPYRRPPALEIARELVLLQHQLGLG